MSTSILVLRIVEIICRQQWQSKIFAQFEELRFHAALYLNTVIHHFKEEVLFTKDISKLTCCCACFFICTHA